MVKRTILARFTLFFTQSLSRTRVDNYATIIHFLVSIGNTNDIHAGRHSACRNFHTLLTSLDRLSEANFAV